MDTQQDSPQGGAPRRIHVVGSPISKSVSPLFHRSALNSLTLPWTVSLLETVESADVKAAMQAPDFAGSAVSLPLKTDVIPLLDRLNDDAKALGAVNTIFVRHKHGSREFVGANTDWKGMTSCILDRIGPNGGARVGAVVGAGVLSRTATYALVVGLGLRTVYLVQCPPEGRQATEDMLIAAGIGGLELIALESAVQALGSLGVWPLPHVIVNVVRNPEDPGFQEGQLVGKHFITNSNTPSTAVLLDMASLQPGDTDLVIAARECGWKTASFVDFMAHQATQQIILWTGADVSRLPPIEASVALLKDALCR